MTGIRESNRTLPITDSALAEFSELAAGFDGAAWNEAVAAFGEYIPEGQDLDPWAQIAARIDRCVDAGRPASFIRLGDGEGNLLSLGLDEQPALAEHCVRVVSLRHFGDPDVLVGAGPEVLGAFHAALRNADLIGFPGPFGAQMMLKRSAPETYARPIQGLVAVHRYLIRFADDLRLGPKTGTPARFHRGLLPHYQDLISGRRVGIVTCHGELAEGLRTRMGAAGVDLRRVPRQAIVAESSGDTEHWPGRFRELSTELRAIEPGTLWFVAAGPLGKIYCDVIRASGGIAVDIGHAADIWAGLKSRVYDQTELLAAWRIV